MRLRYTKALAGLRRRTKRSDLRWRSTHRIKVKSFLSRDQHRLYKLIWERFIASQMSPAVMDATTVDIQAGEYLFRASGSVVRFPGFLRVYKATEAAEQVLPELHEGELLTLVKLAPEQHFTQPPPRYTEAALVKMLEEKGIGRPSTYATIIETVQTRGYVVKQEKNLVPTDLGFIVVDLLKDYFPQIIDVEFTASMEEKLDEIEEGGTAWQKIVEEFYQPFEENLEHAEQAIENISLAEEQSEEQCPKCGRYLTIKQGRFGKFLACPGFPDCRHTQRYYEQNRSLLPALRRDDRGASIAAGQAVLWLQQLPRLQLLPPGTNPRLITARTAAISWCIPGEGGDCFAQPAIRSLRRVN